MLHLVQSEEGYVSPEGVRVLRRGARPDQGRGRRGRDVLHDVQAPAGRRVPGQRLHQHAVRRARRRARSTGRAVARTSASATTRPRPDGSITLEHAECLAACDYAPVVTVNYEFYDQQTSSRRSALVAAAAAGRQPLPTRGAPLCTFREISPAAGRLHGRARGRAGRRPGGRADAGRHRLAVQRGETAPRTTADPARRPTRRRAAAPAPAGDRPARGGDAARHRAGRRGRRCRAAAERRAPASGPAARGRAGQRGGAVRRRHRAVRRPPGEPSSGGARAAPASRRVRPTQPRRGEPTRQPAAADGRGPRRTPPPRRQPGRSAAEGGLSRCL